MMIIFFFFLQCLATTSLNVFLLNVNFDKSTIEWYIYIFISYILAKFSKGQKSVAMFSIKCLNFKFL